MCIFCRIASHEVPASVVFEDDTVIAFRDLQPQAPTHVLVIPKEHIESLDAAKPESQALLGKLLIVARQVAVDCELAERGYRVVINTGDNGGQSVFHLHVHVLGGRQMHWPPG